MEPKGQPHRGSIEAPDGGTAALAFGCSLSDMPEDRELAKLQWIGRKGGWSCGQTKKGCWHIQIAARCDALVAIGAMICMPNEPALHQLIATLERKSEAETVEFIESLPTIHAQAEEHRLQAIRSEILRP